MSYRRYTRPDSIGKGNIIPLYIMISICAFIIFIICLLKAIIYPSSINTLLSIIVFLSFVFVLFLTILLIKGINYFYIALNHTFYFNERNIFTNAKLISTKKIIKYKKALGDRLLSDDYKIYQASLFNLKFKVYELKDDMQLIIITDEQEKRFRKSSSYKDYVLNLNNYRERKEIPDITADGNILEIDYSKDKLHGFILNEDHEEYYVNIYSYSNIKTSNINKVFNVCLPHWTCLNIMDNTTFDLHHKAQYYLRVQKEYYNFINEIVTNKLKYFDTYDNLERNEDGYYQFTIEERFITNEGLVQRDNFSIFLPYRLMQNSGLIKLFTSYAKEVGLGYFLNIDKNAFLTIRNQAWEYSEEAQAILKEMLPWAMRTIMEYCHFCIYYVEN